MKTSTKNFITMSVFMGIVIVWAVAGAVATGVGKASLGFWITFGVLIAILFGIAGIGAENAEDKASKK